MTSTLLANLNHCALNKSSFSEFKNKFSDFVWEIDDRDVDDYDQFFLENYQRVEQNEILPGVKWGNYCQLYTPAFWKYLYIKEGRKRKFQCHKLGRTIIEEIVACLLGGYGIPSEIGLLIFEKIKEEGLIKPGITFTKIEQIISNPIPTKEGKLIRYRFSNQKSRYIHKFLNRSDIDEIPVNDDLELRSWLLSVDGIGFKTASWITRNWLKSEKVAILDIHVLRAGMLTGFFKHMDVTNHYLKLESDFIEFCEALDVPPSDMDAIIWRYMKNTNWLALKLLYS